MARRKDDFSKRTRGILAERVAFLCSNPDCHRLTVGPHSAVDQSLRIGRACHVKGAAPKSARYDVAQPSEERRSIRNGIWLCAICSDLIDKDESTYPTGLLHGWKDSTEAQTLLRLKAA